MSVFAFIAADLVAISIMVFALYFPRHRRRDLIVAFLSINVGVMGVTYAMATADLSLGFGLGIFAVLSIIRLRSTELGQQEVAFYFAALTLGLIGGIELDPVWLSVVLPATILGVLYLGDHPRLFRGYRHQVVTLDRAIADERELVERLETTLGCRVGRYELRKLDLVNDTTTVDVRYRLRDSSRVSVTA